VTEGFEYRDGVLYLTGKPGLGITVDEEKVMALTGDGWHRTST
jgi:L-alanine-DL-glutamate epimerase-like enolase superfamily enzyme